MDVFAERVYLRSNNTWKIALSLWKQLWILTVFSYASKGHIHFMHLFCSLERALMVIYLVCKQALSCLGSPPSLLLFRHHDLAEPQTCSQRIDQPVYQHSPAKEKGDFYSPSIHSLEESQTKPVRVSVTGETGLNSNHFLGLFWAMVGNLSVKME